MIVHKVVGVTEVDAGLALEEVVVGAEDAGLVGHAGPLVVREGDGHAVLGKLVFLVGTELVEDVGPGTPRVEDGPGRRRAALGLVGGVVRHGFQGVVGHFATGAGAVRIEVERGVEGSLLFFVVVQGRRRLEAKLLEEKLGGRNGGGVR